MNIVRVQEKEPFVPVAIEINEDLDVTFLSELVKNTYPGEGDARKRGEGEIGAGGIDIYYGSGDYDREYLYKGFEGWIVLDERYVISYREDHIWADYELVD